MPPREGQQGIYIVSANGGRPRRLTSHAANDIIPLNVIALEPRVFPQEIINRIPRRQHAEKLLDGQPATTNGVIMRAFVVLDTGIYHVVFGRDESHGYVDTLTLCPWT